jgi:hypothetical protein
MKKNGIIILNSLKMANKQKNGHKLRNYISKKKNSIKKFQNLIMFFYFYASSGICTKPLNHFAEAGQLKKMVT